MFKPRNASKPILIGLLALAVAVPLLAQPAPLSTPLKLTAYAVNMAATRPSAQASIVDIQIDRWSSEEERQSLRETLRAQGADHLLSALQKSPKVGFIRTPDSIAWDIHYARTMAGDDGSTRIILGTDRRMSFWELTNRERSVDYPFTIIEIRLDRNGKGEGRMSIATKVTASDQGDIHLEDYSVEPVRLQNVQVRK
jgi:hypothetical protein